MKSMYIDYGLTVAFCFYNLSSIINGLVYYDQFALLSTRNLLLVVLGTIILIAGVWAVSLQSVDVGPYTAEPDSEASSALDVAVADDDETSALAPLVSGLMNTIPKWRLNEVKVPKV